MLGSFILTLPKTRDFRLPVRPELVEGLSSRLLRRGNKGKGFDWLSPNGRGWTAGAAPLRAARSSAKHIPLFFAGHAPPHDHQGRTPLRHLPAALPSARRGSDPLPAARF